MIRNVNVTKFLSASRRPRNLLLRVLSILSRFGITARRFRHKLDRYRAVTRSLGCTPTLAVTAVTLRRHARLIRKLSRQGIELAVHGYIHTDYRLLPLEEQSRHFKKAIDAFESCQIPFSGFRAPFLRINGKTPKALSNFGFSYDSSRIIHWNVVDRTRYAKHSSSSYDRLLDFYQPRESQQYLALPRFTNGFVEIPVSIPDDEAMVDRLGITDKKEIAEIWKAILETTYARGELFTMQLHPERILLCENALAETLRQAREHNPSIWIATLGEIARWWKERDEFTLQVNCEGNGRYRVKADCSDKATLLLKNCMANVPATEWSNGYQSISARDFVIETRVRPVIGVALDSSATAVSFLESEGFIVERSHQADDYGIYIDNLAQFQEADEKPLSERVEQSNAPLLRYWRWPHQAKSALSITGDIDSVTIIDFALRILENWRQNRKVSADGAKGSS